MRTLSVIPLYFGAALLLCFQAAGLSQVRPITKADTVLAVYTDDWGLHSSGEIKLLVGIWSDGHAVWSDNQVRGGDPYRSGFVEPTKLHTLLARLERDGAFADKRLAGSHFGPDSKFTVVFVKAGERLLKMESWHELYEEGGAVVDTSAGLVPLDGRKREDVLQRQPKDYREYRAAWKQIRELARALLPKTSYPVKGMLTMKEGLVTWVEEAAAPPSPKVKRRR